MSFSFKRGSKLIIDDGTDRYLLKVADFNFSETFIEKGYEVSTLHSPVAVSNRTYVNSKSNCTFDFEMYFSDSKVVERKILEWYGFSASGEFPVLNSELTKTFDVYVDVGDKVIWIDNVILENLSFKLDPRGILGMSVTAKGFTSMMDAISLPNQGTLYQQGTFTNEYIEASVPGLDVSRVAGATLELTRDITWLSNQTVHDAFSDTLYIPEDAIGSNLAVAGNITTIRRGTEEPKYLPDVPVTLTLGDYMTISLGHCNITQRADFGSGVLKTVSDFKLLNSTDSQITI